ncbi:MAG: U32 family peptidase [Bacilli bacterium]|nr:U32 family peptidase [Bacilli bacterium]
MKIISMPTDISNLKQSLLYCDCFVVGIKDFSIGHSFYLTIEELKELIPILKDNNKEIFVSLNKIMHNDDISRLEKIIIELNKLDIDGLLYGDIALINMINRLNLKIPLIWAQSHLVTNYQTCNFWYKRGIKKAIISEEITLNEILEINNNTNMKLIVPVYGFLTMFLSKRKLLSNYFNFIKEQKQESIYYLYEKSRNSNYPIIEEDNGTYILNSDILNGLDELPILINNNIDYVLLNGLNHDSDTFLEVLKRFSKVKTMYNKLSKIELDKVSSEINDLLKFPVDKGFYYKETIYKVKNNE